MISGRFPKMRDALPDNIFEWFRREKNLLIGSQCQALVWELLKFGSETALRPIDPRASRAMIIAGKAGSL